MRTLVLFCALLLVSSIARSEIEKIAIPGEKGLAFYWWPKVAAPKGWHQDRAHSFHYSANALAPDGLTFKTAETVMYATAIYKPRVPDVKSLEMLIENDRKDFVSNVPGVVIQEAKPLTNADGQRLRSFTFFPSTKGNWERVAYGEEDEFYLIFTVSSRSEPGFNSAVSAYENLVTSYKK